MTTRILINHVKRATGAVYGVTNIDLDARDRHRRFAEPRQMAMAVAKHLTEQSWAQIGRAFLRDEKAVRHAAKAVEARAGASRRDRETFLEIARLARVYADGGNSAAKFSRAADLSVIPNDAIRELDRERLPRTAISQRLGVSVTEVARVLETA